MGINPPFILDLHYEQPSAETQMKVDFVWDLVLGALLSYIDILLSVIIFIYS